jgi:hypothetical protein
VHCIGGLGVVVPNISCVFAVSGGKVSRGLSHVSLLAHFACKSVYAALFKVYTQTVL